MFLPNSGLSLAQHVSPWQARVLDPSGCARPFRVRCCHNICKVCGSHLLAQAVQYHLGIAVHVRTSVPARQGFRLVLEAGAEAKRGMVSCLFHKLDTWGSGTLLPSSAVYVWTCVFVCSCLIECGVVLLFVRLRARALL